MAAISSVLRNALLSGASVVAMRRTDDIDRIESEGRYFVPEPRQAAERAHTTRLGKRT
ncbi:hypothetical protein [uncultured Rikenella sp.]|nr:hypothetical protein [uncultured Rikenella sp.]